MAGELLLDTGALVSLLDRSQVLHEPCAACLRGWTGPIVTTEAVLTEATHLLGRVKPVSISSCAAVRSLCRRHGSRSRGVAC